MPVMSKKKPVDDKPKDQHTSKRMVRLSEPLHALLREAARRSDRPMSRELKVALLKHFREQGMEIPPEME